MRADPIVHYTIKSTVIGHESGSSGRGSKSSAPSSGASVCRSPWRRPRTPA